MKGIGIVMKKELARVFKDKKIAFSMFILPVILIVGMFALIGNLMDKMVQDIEEHQTIVYIQNAPEDFRTYLIAQGETSQIEYIDEKADVEGLKEQIRQGEVDLIIEFTPDFKTSVANYDVGSAVPQVKTYYNPSEEYSSKARSDFVTGVLEGYRQQLLTERIGDLSSIAVFTIDSDNPEMIVQDDQKAAGKMLGMLLPYFITLMLFAGVMGIGIDAITGEKERGTIANLLLTPVNRTSIVLGKIIALMILSGLSAMIYVVSMVTVMPRFMNPASGGDNPFGDLALSFSPGQVMQLVLLMVSLVFLYVALVSLVAVYAKTIKEGSTYIMPIYIVVIAAGMITMYGTKEPQLAHYLIPLYNSSLAIKGLFTQELSLVEFMLTFFSTLAAGGILTGIIVKAFNNEKVMFNA
ncbi:MAG: ABC transporter permease [Peptococcia bacterium]